MLSRHARLRLTLFEVKARPLRGVQGLKTSRRSSRRRERRSLPCSCGLHCFPDVPASCEDELAATLVASAGAPATRRTPNGACFTEGAKRCAEALAVLRQR